MKVDNSHTEPTETIADLGIDRWENEGGANGHDFLDHHYGRRVEADRSWTVYHVFTGIPARIDGSAMTGLSRKAATNGMLSLNRRTEARRRDGRSLMTCFQAAPSGIEDCRQ